MLTRVHISLEVSDLDRAVAFDARLFQREPTKRMPGYANVRMETPQLHLALVHRPERSPEPHSHRHYGIELFADDTLKDWLKAAQAANLEPRVEEETTCCYAVSNKFWAKDPDGHAWEFWVRKGEADTVGDDAAANDANASACGAPQAEAPVSQPGKKSACCAPGPC